MSDAEAERGAIQELVRAQKSYDAALAALVEARERAVRGQVGGVIADLDEGAKLIRTSREAVLRAALEFKASYEALASSQKALDRALALLAAAKEPATQAGIESTAIERAERHVEEGRARLMEAGRLLREARRRS